MSKRFVMALVTLAAALVLLAWLLRSEPEAEGPRSTLSQAPSPEEGSRAAARRSAGGDEAPGSRKKAVVDQVRAKKLRAFFVELARRTQDTEAPGAGASPGVNEHAKPEETPAPKLGRLDPSYVQDAMREILPLLGECHELATDGTEAPVEGKLVTSFEIFADPDQGGVIANSLIIKDKSTLSNAILEECVRETMYGLILPAPEEGGQVTVKYPLVFREEDPESKD